MQADHAVGRAAALRLPWAAWRDLRLALAGAGLLVALVALGERAPPLAPLRLLLGLAYVLFVPGYCLAAALFPRADDLDGVERAGLSLGLSVAAVPLLALLLDRLPWGLTLWPIAGAELAVIGLASLIAAWRRARLPARVAFAPAPELRPRRWWRALPTADRRVYTLAAGALAVAALCAAWVLLVPAPDTYMTEFYALGPAGRAEDFPRQAAAGEPLTVTAGIANRERATHIYRVEVWAQDTWQPERRARVGQTGPVSLAPGEETRVPVGWAMPWPGPDQQVELLLFRDDGAEPYRRLLLWLDVPA